MDKYHLFKPGMLPDGYKNISKNASSVTLDINIVNDKKLKLAVEKGELMLGERIEKKTEKKAKSKKKKKK